MTKEETNLISAAVGFDFSNPKEVMDNSTFCRLYHTLGEAKVDAKKWNKLCDLANWSTCYYVNVYKITKDDDCFVLSNETEAFQYVNAGEYELVK